MTQIKNIKIKGKALSENKTSPNSKSNLISYFFAREIRYL
jgi:hypothetical protein